MNIFYQTVLTLPNIGINGHTISLGQSLLEALTNFTCIISYMTPQYCKFFTDQAHKLSGCTIISRLLHDRSSHLVTMGGDTQSELATLVFKQEEKVESFHGRTLRLHKETNIYGETVSPTRILLQYTEAL